MSVSIWKDNTSPSVQDTIRVNRAAFDLTSCTVRFRMRPDTASSSVLKVDAAAVIVDAVKGQVRYDWDPSDTDESGDFLAWWNVTLPSADEQDTQEFQVRVQEHVDTAHDYITLSDLQNSLTPDIANSFGSDDMQRAVSASSRAVDFICRRRFWLDGEAVDRYYTAAGDVLQITDLTDASAITVTVDGEEWTRGTDYLLEPLNAAADGVPYEQIRGLSEFSLDPAAVVVNGQFGWLLVPPGVSAATSIIAGKLLLRMRQAPLGFQLTEVNAIRIGSSDTQVTEQLSSLIRVQMLKSLSLG